jgi:3'(2'), 5'-bisphosphate nucleotidase
MAHERELAVALEACQLVRQPILAAYSGFRPIPDAAADIKLQIDRQTQETILQHLHAAFPDDGLRAEEDTLTLARVQRLPRNPERTWIIDPIDGTRGFAMKNGEFSVMVALLERDEVVVGVVLEPVRQRLTYAVRGGGCWSRDEEGEPPVACHVSRVSDLTAATLTLSRSSGTQKSRFAEAAGLERIVRVYSAGIKMALVARGETDLYLNTYANFHDWDVCAGHVLVEEAGGRVSSRLGEPICYGKSGASQRQGLLASNGVLHDAAVAVLRTS